MFYVEMNPVKARMVRRARQYRWGSAATHFKGRDDALVPVEPLRALVGDWGRFLSRPVELERIQKLQIHERTERPPGSDRFVAKLERRLHRVLRPGKPGRKPQSEPRKRRAKK